MVTILLCLLQTWRIMQEMRIVHSSKKKNCKTNGLTNLGIAKSSSYLGLLCDICSDAAQNIWQLPVEEDRMVTKDHFTKLMETAAIVIRSVMFAETDMCLAG